MNQMNRVLLYSNSTTFKTTKERPTIKPAMTTTIIPRNKIAALIQTRRTDKDPKEKDKTTVSPTLKHSSLDNTLNFSTSSTLLKSVVKKESALTHKQPDEFELFASKMSLHNFNLHFVIGKGGFGKVWKVELRKNRQLYAMKEMLKARILSKRSVNSVMNERYLLSYLKHHFLVNMVCSFQDRDNVYLVMDLLTGGDLRFHICKRRRFTEEQTKFIIASIFIGLEYLHKNGIIHRDIKPENIVFDNKGYCRVTDLGIARVWRNENGNDTSGTPGYMAPEVMCRQNHGIAVDYFALGIIAFEMMIGKRPYLGKNRQEIKEQILSKQVQIRKVDIPDGWSIEAADFINRMIQRKPINRLGVNGPDEVKNHPWLKNFPWTRLLNREILPPFQPSRKEEENFEYKQVMQEDPKDPYLELDKENLLLLRRDSVQALFNGYTFDS